MIDDMVNCSYATDRESPIWSSLSVDLPTRKYQDGGMTF
jgi:hypothetical protein